MAIKAIVEGRFDEMDENLQNLINVYGQVVSEKQS